MADETTETKGAETKGSETPATPDLSKAAEGLIATW